MLATVLITPPSAFTSWRCLRKSLVSIGVVLSVAAVSMAVTLSPISYHPFSSTAPAAPSNLTTFSKTPSALHTAIVKKFGPGVTMAHQLGATYSPKLVTLSGDGVQFSVGRPSVGSGTDLRKISLSLTHETLSSVYGSGNATESFKPVASGIEQTFRISHRPSGKGPLSIKIPISGLRAVLDGRGIGLQDSKKVIRTTFQGLHVTDSRGRAIPSTMLPSNDGHSIQIILSTTDVRYPITVDPTWSLNTEIEFDVELTAVAVAGNVAAVGTFVNAVPSDAEVNIFTLSDGVWTNTQTIPSPGGSDEFGYTESIYGSTLVIGDEDNGVYVYNFNGSTWTLTQTLPNPGSFINFGHPVATNGTTIAVDDNALGYNNDGTVYIYSLTSGVWSLTNTLTDPNATNKFNPNLNFGSALAFSGSSLAIGADNDYIVNTGSSGEGLVYYYTESGKTYSLDQTIQPIDETNANAGASVSISGNTMAIGAPGVSVSGNADQGAVYLWSYVDGSWDPGQEVYATSGQAADDALGASNQISGSTLVVGAPDYAGTRPGKVFTFTLTGGSWIQTQDFEAPDAVNGDTFGTYVGNSGTTAVVGEDTGGTRISNFYIYSYSTSFLPNGPVPTIDTYGGGTASSPAECACSAGTTSLSPATLRWLANDQKGDPVDTATGDFADAATDITLPGAGVPLEFTRTYDAQAAQAEAIAADSAGTLGYGWTDNFDSNVSYNTSTQIATVTEADGAQTMFSPYVSGTSPAWCTGVTNFCAVAPRFEATLNENSDSSWSYVTYSGSPTTYTFSPTGALTSIADSIGDTVSSSPYTPVGSQTVCPGGDTCVAWTNSDSGRELVLATDSAGQLTEVFDANSSLAANFSYSGSACSTWTGSEIPDLCSVSDPGDIASSYTYDSGNSNVDFDYDMLSFSAPESSSQSINAYNSVGQVSQQTDADGDVTTFAYAGTNSSALGGTTTLTTYPNGTGGAGEDVTVDAYSSNTLVSQTTGYGTSSAATTTINRDPNSLLPLSVTNADGNTTVYTYQTYSGTGGTEISSSNVLTSTDPEGNVTTYAYDADNQIYCVLTPWEKDSGEACPTSPPTVPNFADVQVNIYNASAQLIETHDATWNITSYSYTSGVPGVPNGLLYCVTGPNIYANQIPCPAYGASHVTGTTTYTFDSYGDETSVTDPDGNTATYAYALNASLPGLVSSSTSPDGTLTTYSYDGSGEVTSSTATFGSYSATTIYAYDTFGRRYCEVDAYEYANGVTCPSSVPAPPSPGSDPYLGATITNYDPDGHVIQSTNPLGGISYAAYDDAGELFCTVAPANSASGTNCPSSADAPTSPPSPGSDPYLGATITTNDPNGRVSQTTNPLGGITALTHDADGNILSTTTESNNVNDPDVAVTYTYTTDGQIYQKTTAVGTSVFEYDPNGDLFCSISARVYLVIASQCPAVTSNTSWSYAPPNLASLYSSEVAENVSLYFYNEDGQLAESSNADGHATIYEYNPNGDVYCTSDPTNVDAYMAAHPSSTYPLNCPASPITSPPATGSNPGYVTTIYDADGNVLSTTNQLGDTTAYTYSPGGQVLTTSDGRGEITTNCYYYETTTCASGAPSNGGSADDLYSTITAPTSADPSGEVTTNTYFPGDLPDKVTTPAATSTYAYDAMGNMTSTSYSGVASGYATPVNTSTTFNVDGSPDVVTDATGRTSYTYDAMGDVTGQSYLAGSGTGLANSNVSYTYYATGDLASIVYPSYGSYPAPTVNYTYDDTGSLSSSTDWLGNETTYSYNQDGYLSEQDNNAAGSDPSPTTLTYDAADQLTGTSSSIDQTCGSAETLAQSLSPSAGPGTGSVNDDNQLTEYATNFSATCSGQVSREQNYSYDLAGDLVYQGSVAQGTSANNFAYDASGDPTTISAHSGSSLDTYTQTFDAAGEVTGQTPIAGSGGATSTYTYDTLGDQIKDVSTGTSTYGFNAAGEMSTATTASGTTNYLYNSQGLEASATSPASPPTPFWNSPVDVNSTRAIDAITCVSSTLCVAVGASGYATIYNGTSWSTPADVDSTRTMDAVSCVSSTFCVAVDTAGYAVIYNGSSWGTPTDIDSTRSINAISCASSTFCVAVGASGYAAKYTGTWATATDVDSTRAMDAIACTSSTFCVTGDTTGYSAKYTGTWATATDIDASRSISTIACTSSTFCVTGDTTGYSAKYTGTWATATDVDSTRSIKEIVCESSTFCVAIGSAGYAALYTGSWATATDIDNATALESVSCASASFCEVNDAAGNVLTYNGTAWSYPTSVDAARTGSSISCPTSSFCASVDTSGYASVLSALATPGPSTSQLTWNTVGPTENILSDGSYDYIYGPNSTPVEEILLSSSTPTYLTFVPSAETYVATNDAGDLVSFWGYDAYGTLDFGTPDSAFGFSGQYTDTSTGLVNDRARLYNPATGEFTSRDPAFGTTDIAYGYADDDPVNLSDPTGQCVLGICWGSVGHTIASGFDQFRHQNAALGDAISPIRAAESAYHVYQDAYRAGQDGWCWSVLPSLALTAGLDDLGAIVPLDPEAEASADAVDILSGLASKAQVTVGEGSGAVYGTAVHSEFAAEINALGDSNLSTEVSYLDGRIVPYGTRGSVRLDVVEGDPLEPSAVYDLKTGSATLTPQRIAQIRANLPSGYQDVPVTEIRP